MVKFEWQKLSQPPAGTGKGWKSDDDTTELPKTAVKIKIQTFMLSSVQIIDRFQFHSVLLYLNVHHFYAFGTLKIYHDPDYIIKLPNQLKLQLFFFQ